MAFYRQHLAITALIVGLSTISFGQDLRSHIAEVEKQRAEQELSIDNLRSDLAQKTMEIDKIKSTSGTGIVSKLVLQKKLREAQTVSKDLENLVKEHAQLSNQLRQERSKLLRDIDDQVQAYTINKNSRNLADLQQLQKLIGEKDQLLILQQKELLEVPEFSLSSSANSKEDLVEKLQVVEDLQKNMQLKVAFLKDEISEERSKDFLRNEVSHFIDEENFFGEQSFISNGINRKDSSKNLSALALKKDSAAAAVPTTTTPTTTPTTQPSSTGGTPTTEPSSSSTTSTTAASTTTTTQVTSESTSFQQPQELNMFETLLDQIQGSIRETNPKQTQKSKNEIVIAKNQDKKLLKKNKQGSLEQNLAISEKILDDLNVLRQNLNQKIQELE